MKRHAEVASEAEVSEVEEDTQEESNVPTGLTKDLFAHYDKVHGYKQKPLRNMATHGSVLHKSPALQHVIHQLLTRFKLVDSKELERIAIFLGVSYIMLEEYLDDMYPNRDKFRLRVADYQRSFSENHVNIVAGIVG